MYVGQGSSQAVVQDSGPAGGGGVGLGLSELLQVNRTTGTGPLNTHSCFYDNPITNPSGYHYLCFDANANGGGLISYGAGGIAAPLPLSFLVNGVPLTTPGIPVVPTQPRGDNSTNAASTAFVQQAASSLNVQLFGALGDSNGTTGNGTDDTNAIRNAILGAPNGDVFFPCGIYRITNTVTISGTGTYHLHGNGFCSKIFLDALGPVTALNFNTASLCSTAQLPCVVIEGLNFITPTNNGLGNNAIIANNQQKIRIANNWFSGYRSGIGLSLSYGPEIIGNTFVNFPGTAITTAADNTANSMQIVGNRLFGVGQVLSLPGISIGSGFGVLITGNDLETTGGILFQGTNSVAMYGNYIENSLSYNFYWGAGSNNSYDIAGNWFGASAATQLENVNGVRFDNNTIFNWVVTFGSTAVGVSPPNHNLLTGGASLGPLPAPNSTSCGTSPGTPIGTRYAGQQTEGTTSTGCTITFELAFGAAPICTVTPLTSFSSFTATPSASGIVVTHGNTSSGIFSWSCAGNG